MSFILKLAKFIRYRFFLFAGIFPYLLGQSIAFNATKKINWHNFYLGFFGIFLVLIGVELFNEYFDSQAGGDRIFNIEESQIPRYFYIVGLLVFILAFFIGLYFSYAIGWQILLFAFLGFLCAYFYVGPPFKWAYHGLGEFVIFLSYGPFMVLGSYYLQTKKIELIPFYASLLCGFSIFCLAILNEIPDYYQDQLIGKRNLVVRMGKEKSIKFLKLCFVVLFLFLAFGLFLNKFPLLTIVNFLLLPWLLKSLSIAEKNYENPKIFCSVVNANVIVYLAIVLSLSLGYIYD